jgi:hypothetical protein
MNYLLKNYPIDKIRDTYEFQVSSDDRLSICGRPEEVDAWRAARLVFHYFPRSMQSSNRR